MTYKVLSLKNHKGKARRKVVCSNTCDSHKPCGKTDSELKRRESMVRKIEHPVPKGRDPWKYAEVPQRFLGDPDVLHVRLKCIESELAPFPQPAAEDNRGGPSIQNPSVPVESEELYRARSDAIDAYFNLPRETGKTSSPADVFVENGYFVLRFALHFVIQQKKPIALRSRRHQLLRALMANNAGKTMREKRAEASAAARDELREMPPLHPFITQSVQGIAQAITNLGELCESGDGTVVIAGVRLPVRVELVSLTEGSRPQKGALNVKVYSQRPEVRNKLSPHYNVSHAYMGTAVIPYLSDLMAKLGFCDVCINLMIDKDGVVSPHLHNVAIHELLHTFGLQDQYRKKGEKTHPDIADNDIMFTVGPQARIHNYVFNKIFTLAKRLKV